MAREEELSAGPRGRTYRGAPTLQFGNESEGPATYMNNPETTTPQRPLFGEWLAAPATGRYLRLVIEQMSERAAGPSLKGATLAAEGNPELKLAVAGDK